MLLRKFECEFEGCKKQFFRQNQLDSHTVQHAGFECSACKNSFQSKAKLKNHLQKHKICRQLQIPSRKTIILKKDRVDQCNKCNKTLTAHVGSRLRHNKFFCSGKDFN